MIATQEWIRKTIDQDSSIAEKIATFQRYRANKNNAPIAYRIRRQIIEAGINSMGFGELEDV